MHTIYDHFWKVYFKKIHSQTVAILTASILQESRRKYIFIGCLPFYGSRARNCKNLACKTRAQFARGKQKKRQLSCNTREEQESFQLDNILARALH